jgi:hypothetical protein
LLNGDNLEPEFIEQIENLKTTNFKINKIPIGSLKEFKKYCREKCGDIYFIGIIQLLETKKKYDEIVPLLSSLQKQIDEIKINKKGVTFG